MPTPQPTTPSKAAETAAVTVLLTNEQLAQLNKSAATGGQWLVSILAGNWNLPSILIEAIMLPAQR